MNYVELVEKGIENRGKIVEKSAIKIFKRDYEAYISLFLFDKEILDYVKKHKSVSSFEGAASSHYLWFDIDHDGEFDEMTDKARDFILNLKIKFGVDPSSLVIYFTGGRGYHIGMPLSLFGISVYKSKDIHLVFKLLALKINNVPYLFDGDKITIIDKNKLTFDLSIYKKVGILRLALSKHKKTKLYKVLIDSKKIINREYYDIIYLTTNGINDTVEFTQPKKINKLADELKDAIQEASSKWKAARDSESFAKVQRSLAKSTLFLVPNIGERNEMLHKQAFRLFMTQTLKYEEVVGIMEMIYELTNILSISAGGSKISYKEFKTIISSAHRSSSIKLSKTHKAQNASTFLEAAIEEHTTSKYISSLSKLIDSDSGGLRHGNYYPMIGARGTKKSIYAQNIAVESAKKDVVSIYANMEMSISTYFDRMLSMIFNSSIDSVSSDVAQNIIVGIENVLKGNLHLINNNDISTREFANMIDEVENTSGKKVSLLIIDSMNSMKLPNPNNETSSCFTITKELKEVSKEKKVAIIQLNHTRQDCPPSLRDNTMYARGGGKITDNADAFFSLFKFVDREMGNPNDYDKIVYKNKYIGVRFENKRGTGNIINTAFKLNDNLTLLECTENDVVADKGDVPDGWERA